MSLKDLNRRRAEGAEEDRSSFQRRLIAQQFLLDAKPLILAAVDKIDGDETLLQALLTDVTMAFLDESDGKDFDAARAERILAVEVAALALSSGKDRDDIAKVVHEMFRRYEEHASGTSQPFPDISDATSMAMTSSNVASTLALAVYECSRMQSLSSDLSRLCNAVHQEVASFILMANPGGAEDVRSLTQTASNKASEMMAACYRRQCSLNAGKGLNCDPVELAIGDFSRLMRTWSNAALAYADMVMKPEQSQGMTP